MKATRPPGAAPRSRGAAPACASARASRAVWQSTSSNVPPWKPQKSATRDSTGRSPPRRAGAPAGAAAARTACRARRRRARRALARPGSAHLCVGIGERSERKHLVALRDDGHLGERRAERRLPVRAERTAARAPRSSGRRGSARARGRDRRRRAAPRRGRAPRPPGARTITPCRPLQRDAAWRPIRTTLSPSVRPLIGTTAVGGSGRLRRSAVQKLRYRASPPLRPRRHRAAPPRRKLLSRIMT